MGYGRQYAGHALTTIAAAVVVGALFYALRILLFRGLTLEEYGLFYAVFSFGVAAQAVLSFGFDPGVTPLVTRQRETGQLESVLPLTASTLMFQLMAALLFAGLCTILAEVLAERLFHNATAATLMFPIAIYVVLMTMFKTQHAVLLGLQAITARNAIDVLRVVVVVIVTAALLRLGYGIRAAAWGYVACAAAGVVTQVAALRAWTSQRGGTSNWRPDLVREAFRSGKYLSIAFGGIVLFSQLDSVMLTLLMDRYEEAVGAYQTAVPTIMILYSLLMAAASSFMPMATTLNARGERDLLRDGIERIYDAAFVLFIPLSIVTACFGDVLMGAMFRRDTVAGPEAFGILACGAIFFFICLFNLQVLSGIGLAGRAGFMIGACLGLNVLLNAALIPPFGIRGAALATVLSFAAAAAWGKRELDRYFARPITMHAGIPAALAGLVTAAVAMGVRTTGLFLTQPYWIAPIAAIVIAAVLIGVLEFAGFGRLRELSAIVTRRSRT